MLLTIYRQKQTALKRILPPSCQRVLEVEVKRMSEQDKMKIMSLKLSSGVTSRHRAVAIWMAA